MSSPLSIVRRFLLSAIALTLLSAAPATASALSCNHRIVNTGDSTYYVQQICGAPTWVTSRTVTRSVYGYVVGPGAGTGSTTTISVQVDVWVYDFGPNRFMVELTFEDGILVNERTLHYGTRNGRPPPSR